MPALRRLLVLAACLGFMLAPAGAALAEGYADALRGFLGNSFADTEKAIEGIAASGDPLAEAVIGALEKGRLFFDADAGMVYYRDAAGALRDAATGEAVAGAEPAGMRPVRVNNRVRRAVSAAMGALTLLSENPARRLAAAVAVFRSRDAAALGALDTAIGQETVPSVRKALVEARAAVLFTSAEADLAERVEAVSVLRARGGQDVLALLASLPAGAPEELVEAAASAATAIRNELAMWNALQNGLYGLSLGSVLLLAAIGLAITFGVMGVINMAHGEMVMLGAYTTFVVQETIRSSAPHLFDWSLAIAIPLAFLVAGTVGLLIERGIIRWLYGRPLETLLATWGLSLILQQLVRTIFGPNNRQVGNPSWMSGALDLGPVSITYNRLWIIVFALVVFAALIAVMRLTRFGLQMRAVTQNRAMASSMGIRTPWVDAFTFALGSGIAGIAGVALSQIDNVSPNLGQSYIIDSFMVVVFGGVGNLWGTLVGALTLGVANKFLEPFAGAVLAKIFILVLIILFIQKRPRGLFALRGRAVEA